MFIKHLEINAVIVYYYINGECGDPLRKSASGAAQRRAAKKLPERGIHNEKSNICTSFLRYDLRNISIMRRRCVIIVII